MSEIFFFMISSNDSKLLVTNLTFNPNEFNSFITFPTLGPPSVTKRTITGFSLPATNPNPSVGLRCSKTFRGWGGDTS